MQERYDLKDLRELRAIAHPLRVEIYELLTQEPMTNKAIADTLGVEPQKTHFHVKELERCGLIRLVESRTNGGVVEKYYRARAKRLDATQVMRAHPEGTSKGAALLAAAREQMLASVRDGVPTQDFKVFHRRRRLTAEQLAELRALIRSWEQVADRDDGGTTEYALTLAFHPTVAHTRSRRTR